MRLYGRFDLAFGGECQGFLHVQARAYNRAPYGVTVQDQIEDGNRKVSWRQTIQDARPATETKHVAHAVAVVQLKEQRSNDVIQAGAKSAAGHDPGARLLRVEKKLCARASHFKL